MMNNFSTMECNETFQVPNMGTTPFQLDVMSTIQNSIIGKCPSDSRLLEWKPGVLVLAMAAAVMITGSPSGFAAIWRWTPYPTDLILQRFLAWKAPLFQLIMQFPRPPHGKSVELFSLLHLVGNPVDTIASLIFTLDVTQRRFRSLMPTGMVRKKVQELTLLINSYEECGEEDKAANLENLFKDNGEAWNGLYESAAHALAADRATKFLPVSTAVIAFLASVALSYSKTATSEWKSTSPWHIEIYSIAFSLTLSSCVSAVLLAATVGVPQSRLSVWRILCQFDALSREPVVAGDGTAGDNAVVDGGDSAALEALHDHDIWSCLPNGAVPSWRFDRWPRTALSESSARKEAVKSWLWRESTAIVVVLIGSAGATILSSRVPPTGCLNCRILCELTICWLYIASYGVGIFLSVVFAGRVRPLFWATMATDVCFALAVTAVILLTVTGSLNQPGCWSSCDGSFLLLPETTRSDIEGRLRVEYPAIIFATLGSMVVAGTCIAWFFSDGMLVFMQLDEKEERFLWLKWFTFRRRKIITRTMCLVVMLDNHTEMELLQRKVRAEHHVVRHR